MKMQFSRSVRMLGVRVTTKGIFYYTIEQNCTMTYRYTQGQSKELNVRGMHLRIYRAHQILRLELNVEEEEEEVKRMIK